MTLQPLVLTLAIDSASQHRFDTERIAWFPPGRTVIGAHVTLFHALPGVGRDRMKADIAAAAARPAFEVSVSEVIPLGRGVAYRLNSVDLSHLHRALQKKWWPELTAQDRQGYRPHVTVQNKVSAEVARHTRATLAAGFAPFSVRAEGLRLWRYDQGPWTHLRDYPFDVSPPDAQGSANTVPTDAYSDRSIS